MLFVLKNAKNMMKIYAFFGQQFNMINMKTLNYAQIALKINNLKLNFEYKLFQEILYLLILKVASLNLKMNLQHLKSSKNSPKNWNCITTLLKKFSLG